jgi:cellulose synthase/poly-beta-1,6-N-acetylglucosamine synthase-like glycosyltransferase
MNFLLFIFWLSAFIIFYTYVGFPIVLYVVAKNKNRVVKKKSIFPPVSLIIPAYNEEDVIEDKIKNSLSLDYPTDAIEIIIASDGSTDRTNDIVRKYSRQGIKLLCLPRKGKLNALNEAINHSNNEILVFSDANTLYEPQALQKLTANFADTEIGGVCGNQLYNKLSDKDHTSKGENFYWKYDKWLKKMESLTGNIVSADGAIYAIRRALYCKPKANDVIDDFTISTAIIEQKHRLVFESDAKGYEKPMDSFENEFSRKLRIINGGLMGLYMQKKMLNPFRYGFYSLILISHKLLRRLVSYFLIFLLISSLFLSTKAVFYWYITIFQAIFYIWVAFSVVIRKTTIGRWKIFYLPSFFCLANAAAFWAILELLIGKRVRLWSTQR